MMHKPINLLAGMLALAGVATAQQKPFTIKGNIKGKTDAYIYLSYAPDESNNGYKMDSALIENGRFSFKGEISGTAQAMVGIGRNERLFFDKYVTLYIAPGEMQLSLDYNNFTNGAVLKGGPPAQAEADQLTKMQAPVMDKIKPLNAAYEKANMAYINARKEKKDEATLQPLKDAAEKAKEALDPYYDQLRKVNLSFMDKYPASYVTATTLRMYVSDMPLEEGETRYGKLPDEVKNSGIGKVVKQELDRLRGGSVGSQAHLFTATELRGEPLSLADYKGKYVLLDFWASWCVPCRKGNPHLLSLYAKYKDKGLEIISISDDDGNRDAWQKAVEKDKIGVWKHVLRGLKHSADWKNIDRSTDISEPYGISSLPTKVLIDPNGIIVGRFGGGGDNDEAMDKKLAAIFGE